MLEVLEELDFDLLEILARVHVLHVATGHIQTISRP